MKPYYKIILLFLVFFLFWEPISNTFDKTTLTYKRITIQVRRGAFHYDTFTLTEDGTVDLKADQETNKQNPYASQTIKVDPQKIKNLAQMIVAEGYFDLNSEYKDNATDQSGLVIEVTIDGESKKIQCGDWKRGCPKIMRQIEDEVVKIQGKGLIRIWLPG